jgi:hypothetical protein
MNSLEAVRSLVRSVIEEEDHPGESKKWDSWPDDVEITHEPTGSKVTIKSASRPTFSSRRGTGHLVKYNDLRQALVTGVETPAAMRGRGGAHAVMSQVGDFLDKHNYVGILNAGSDELQAPSWT